MIRREIGKGDVGPASLHREAERQVGEVGAQGVLAPRRDPLAQVVCRLGDESCSQAHAATLNRDVAFRPRRSAGSLLRLQRQYGNRYVQRMVVFSRRDEGNSEVAPVVERGIQREVGRAPARRPPNPNAVPRRLTQAELRRALSYNRSRFTDPYTVSLIRNVMGINRYPAVTNRDFVHAVVRWQARHNLRQDGRVGAGTTRTLVQALEAGGQRAHARQVRVDHRVFWATEGGPTYRTRGARRNFSWRVGFRTTLRRGWIVQLIVNRFNPHTCDSTLYTGWRPVPRYWEAWYVNRGGVVMPRWGAVNDDWWRRFPSRSRGTWSMTGILYTVLRLPRTFRAHSVRDAHGLRATRSNPGGDVLGLVAGYRRRGGVWNFCPPHNYHRPR